MFKFILNTALAILLISGISNTLGDDLTLKTEYSCPPCYHVKNIFETKTFHKDGQCPVCGMNLIEHHPLDKGGSLSIHTGSGNFTFHSTRSNITAPITVFYHKPKKYNSSSNILVVVPGAGRNAWEYRDSWVELSEKNNVLVVSPFYPERDYDFAAYHLGGVISDIEFRNHTVSKADGRVNKYHLADSDLIKGEAVQSKEWLFIDFDEIFDQVVRVTGSNRRSYDIYGHSAGGQILHRMAIFYPYSKADRIIAANSGSYTLPNFDNDYPLGLKGTEFNEDRFNEVFSLNLTLLTGEQDNESEQRGTMLHTPALDKQGLGRLSRGQSFFRASIKSAKENGATFNWKFCTVEGVGHEYRSMGLAASELLYGDKKCITKMSI